MKTKSKILLSSIALVFASSSFAVLPFIPPAITLGQTAVAGAASLIAHAGLIYGYYKISTSSSKTGIPKNVVFLAPDASTPPSAAEVDSYPALKEAKRYPSARATPVTSGPYTFTIKTSDGKYTYNAVAATKEEVLTALMLCPSHVCTGTASLRSGRGNLYNTDFGYDMTGVIARRYNEVTSMTFSHYSVPTATSPANVHHLEVVFGIGGYNYGVLFKPGIVGCPDGYSLNSTSAVCDLVDATTASVSTGDGLCVIGADGFESTDPDCSSLESDKLLTKSVSSTGQPAYSVKSSDGVIVTKSYDTSTKTATISQLIPSADGGYRREDTAIRSDGAVGPTNTLNTPATPPPLYPGDPGGTEVPGSTGTGRTSIPCGAPGQASCSVTVSGLDTTNSILNSIKASACGGPGQPACSVELKGSSLDPVHGIGDSHSSVLTEKVNGLSKMSSLASSAQCPSDIFSFTLPLPANLGGDYQLSDGGVFCDNLSQFHELIRNLSIAFGLITATYIVLRA